VLPGGRGRARRRHQGAGGDRRRRAGSPPTAGRSCCATYGAVGCRRRWVAVGDGALGLWAALRDVSPTTRHQRDWVPQARQRARLPAQGRAGRRAQGPGRDPLKLPRSGGHLDAGDVLSPERSPRATHSSALSVGVHQHSLTSAGVFPGSAANRSPPTGRSPARRVPPRGGWGAAGASPAGGAAASTRARDGRQPRSPARSRSRCGTGSSGRSRTRAHGRLHAAPA
jgi:hypothetical protein